MDKITQYRHYHEFHIGFLQTEWEIKVLLMTNYVNETENQREEKNLLEKKSFEKSLWMQLKLKINAKSVNLPLKWNQHRPRKIRWSEKLHK